MRSWRRRVRSCSNSIPGARKLLIESVIHSLLDNGALTKDQALEAIRSALEVKEESAANNKEPANVLKKSLRLLTDMQASIGAHSGRYDYASGASPKDAE